MKLKKIIAGIAASIIAISALSANSSANIYVIDSPDKSPHLTNLAGRWMILIQNGDNTASCGIDITQIRSVDFYTEIVVAPEREGELTLEGFDCSKDWFGGAVVFSEGGEKFKEVYGSEIANKYNWNQADWGGLPARGDSAEGVDKGNHGIAEYDKPIVMEFLNDYSYKLSRTMKDDEFFLETPPEYCQIALEEWGHNSDYNLKVNLCAFKDKDGKIILAYDGLGNKISIEDAQAKADEYEAEKDPDPIGENTQASEAETQAPDDSNNNDNTAQAADSAAPASPILSVSHSSSDINFDNTGLILGIVAGIAAVINVIVIFIVFKKK